MGEAREDAKLGSFLKTLRKQSQITQKTLAGRIERRQDHISRIESGAAEPTMTDVVCLAQAFGLEPIDLYRTLDEASTTKRGPRRSTSP